MFNCRKWWVVIEVVGRGKGVCSLLICVGLMVVCWV